MAHWRSLCSPSNHKTLISPGLEKSHWLQWRQNLYSSSCSHCSVCSSELRFLDPFLSLPCPPPPLTPKQRQSLAAVRCPLTCVCLCVCAADPGGWAAPGRDPVRGGAGVQGRQPGAAGHGLLHRPQVPVRHVRAPGECPLPCPGHSCSLPSALCSGDQPEGLHGDKVLVGQEQLGFFCPWAKLGISAWGRAEAACSWLEGMGTELVWGSELFLRCSVMSCRHSSVIELFENRAEMFEERAKSSPC